MTVNADKPDPGRIQGAHGSIAIDLRHLRYFVAVSEELHFRHAAERLFIAQPPLSQAIRKLEDELGVLLLHRTSRVVSVTPAGKVLAEEATKLLTAFDRAVAETRRAGGVNAALRIGCTPRLPMARLLRFVGAVEECDAGSSVQVTHVSTLEQLRSLREGRLDIAIFDHAEDFDDIEMEPLFPGEPLTAFLPPEHELAEKDVLIPCDVRRENLVIFPRAGNPALHDHLVQLLDGAGYRFQRVHEAGGTDPRDLMLPVAGGVGIAVGPLSLKDVTEAGRMVIIRPLDPSPTMPETIIAWAANAPRQLSKKLESIRELAQQIRRSSNEPGASPASSS